MAYTPRSTLVMGPTPALLKYLQSRIPATEAEIGKQFLYWSHYRYLVVVCFLVNDCVICVGVCSPRQGVRTKFDIQISCSE